MTREEAMKLAEEVFDEEYSGLDKDSFLIGFQEAYNALITLYKDKFELVRRMREAQKEFDELPVDCAEVERFGKKAEVIEQAVDNWINNNM